MERSQKNTGVVELGRASTVTQGQPIPADRESDGYFLVGLLAD